MATVFSKQTDLKFNKQSFRELDAPDLFINLWTYNYFKKHKSCLHAILIHDTVKKF